MMSTRLVIRIAPNASEPLTANLLRLAEANGFRNIRPLLSLGRLPGSFATEPCDFSQLAKLCGCEPGQYSSTALWSGCPDSQTFQINGHEIGRNLVSVSTQRICCECLSTGASYQALWDTYGVVCCPTHGCFLTDTCSSCGEVSTWLRRGISRCRCGQSFATPSALPSPRLLSISEALTALKDGRALDPTAMPFTSLRSAVSLLKFLSSWKDGQDRGRSFRISKPTIQASGIALHDCADALLDWPYGFWSWLERQRRDTARQGSLSAAYGKLFDSLRRSLTGLEADNILAEARRFVSLSPEAPFIKSTAYFRSKDPEPGEYVRIEEAAELLGLKRRELKLLVSAKQLVGERRITKSRVHWVLTRRSVEKFRAQTAPYFTLHEASIRLAIPVRLMKSIVAMRNISPIIPEQHRGVFSERDLAQFVWRLDALTAPATADAISMREVFSRSTGNALGVFSAVFARKLSIHRATPSKRPVTLLDFLVSDPGVVSNTPRAISVHVAARALQVNPRMITALTRKGLLDTSSGGRIRDRSRISSASVEAFRRNYILGSEVATAAKSSTRAIISRLRSAGLQPIVPPNSTRGISSVWRRSDVSSILSFGARKL